MPYSASSAEKEFQQCIVQLRSRVEPATVDRVPSNEDELDSTQFFVDEQLPTADYALLQLASLGTDFSTHSLTVGLCGVTNEQIVQEREVGEQFIFPRLYRILALAEPDPKTLVSSIANARWQIRRNLPVLTPGCSRITSLRLEVNRLMI